MPAGTPPPSGSIDVRSSAPSPSAAPALRPRPENYLPPTSPNANGSSTWTQMQAQRIRENLSRFLQMPLAKTIMLTLLFLFAAAVLRDLYFSPQRQITVVGVASRSVAPKTAVVSFTLTHEDTTRQKTLDQGEARFNALLAGLTTFPAAQVERATYQLTDLSQPPLKPGDKAAERYRYLNAARVTLSDPKETEALVAFLYKNGASAVGQPILSPENETTLARELRLEAVQNAKQRVQEVARAAGARVGKVLSIQEGNNAGLTGSAISANKAEDGTINFGQLGEVQLQAAVSVTFELR